MNEYWVGERRLDWLKRHSQTGQDARENDHGWDECQTTASGGPMHSYPAETVLEININKRLERTPMTANEVSKMCGMHARDICETGNLKMEPEELKNPWMRYQLGKIWSKNTPQQEFQLKAYGSTWENALNMLAKGKEEPDPEPVKKEVKKDESIRPLQVDSPQP